MPELWMPGAVRVPSSRKITLNRNAFRICTWHTFECPYSWGIVQAAQYLINQASEATFVLHPRTGEVAQLQPVNVGARTLRAGACVTNAFGTIHVQIEVIGYARQPFTSDLTAAGRAGLRDLLEFLHSHGIPYQWATGVRPPVYPGPGVRRIYPTRSGHYFHAGWPCNDHGDPGAIADLWTAAGIGDAPRPAPLPPPAKPIRAGSVWEVVGINANDPDGGLVIRTDPGITQGTYGSPIPNGTRWHATGQGSGPWIQGRTDWMLSNGAAPMWVHSGYLDPVTVTDGPVYETTADRLNIRTGPGSGHGIYGSSMVRGTTWYGTGLVVSGWVQGRSPWMQANNVPPQWVSGDWLREKSDQDVRTIQTLLVSLGHDLDVDGRWGDITEAAARTYAKDFAYPGDVTDHSALITHLEDTMSKIDTLIAKIDELAAPIPLARGTREALGTDLTEMSRDKALELALRASSRAHGTAKGLEAAFATLASQIGGVDVEAVTAAARQGAEDALESVTIEVTAAATATQEEE